MRFAILRQDEDETPGLAQDDAHLNKYKPWGMTGIVFFAHEFHISELLLGLFVAMAIVMMFLALVADIKGIVYAAFLLVTSLVALVRKPLIISLSFTAKILSTKFLSQFLFTHAFNSGCIIFLVFDL